MCLVSLPYVLYVPTRLVRFFCKYYLCHHPCLLSASRPLQTHDREFNINFEFFLSPTPFQVRMMMHVINVSLGLICILISIWFFSLNETNTGVVMAVAAVIFFFASTVQNITDPRAGRILYG